MIWYSFWDKFCIFIECFLERLDSAYFISQVELWESHSLQVFESADGVCYSCKLWVEEYHEPEILLQTRDIGDEFLTKIWFDNFYHNIPSSELCAIYFSDACFWKWWFFDWIKLILEIFFENKRRYCLGVFKIFLIELGQNGRSLYSDKISPEGIELTYLCSEESLSSDAIEVWFLTYKNLIYQSEKRKKGHDSLNYVFESMRSETIRALSYIVGRPLPGCVPPHTR